MAKRLFFELVIKIGDGVTGPNLCYLPSKIWFAKELNLEVKIESKMDEI